MAKWYDTKLNIVNEQYGMKYSFRCCWAFLVQFNSMVFFTRILITHGKKINKKVVTQTFIAMLSIVIGVC